MGSWGVVRLSANAVITYVAAGWGTACGRIGFDAGSSIDDARRDDAPSDGPLAFGPWSTPTEILAMQTDAMEFGPTFSPDANEVYVSQRFTGDADIYRYTRIDAASEFSGRQGITAVNLAISEEGEPSLSDDGLALYFNRYAPDRIYVSTRPTINSIAWSAPQPIVGPFDGFRSPDFAGDLRMVVTASSFLWETTRASPTASWLPPMSLGIVGDVPCLRRDGLELLWEGAVTINGNATVAIFRATRASVDEAFGAPERLSFGALDVAGVGDPELSHDGRQLIFSAEEVPGRGTYDIYIAHRDLE